MTLVAELRAFVDVLLRTMSGVLRGRYTGADVVRQLYEIGNRSLIFVCITLGFLGMVLVFQTCLQVTRITGDLSQVGAEFIKILVHEFAPSLTAMMLATRVGAGIAAEIGSMAVTEQIDALRMCDVDPIDYLIVPRFIASTIMTVTLTIVGACVAVFMGALTARFSFHVNPTLFFDVSRVTGGDLVTGLVKCGAYGAAIPIVAGACGLSAHGGSEGVGGATTRAVIASSFVVIVLDFLLSGAALFTTQRGGL